MLHFAFLPGFPDSDFIRLFMTVFATKCKCKIYATFLLQFACPTFCQSLFHFLLFFNFASLCQYLPFENNARIFINFVLLFDPVCHHICDTGKKTAQKQLPLIAIGNDWHTVAAALLIGNLM